MASVLNFVRPLRALPLILVMATLGCRAQNNPASASAGVIQPGAKLSPDMARRVEVLIRSKSQMSPDYTINIGDPQKSSMQGYVEFPVTFTANGSTSRPMTFFLSEDGKTLGQFNKFDVSQDPKLKVSGAGRPARGGPENAPVLIVGFDDLECPYCAKMHAELFPALLDRYKDKVRIVYRDFPLDQHPWAVHAAVDANCLGAESTPAYWNYVDYVHGHAQDIGAPENTLPKATQALDKLAMDEGTRQKLDTAKLDACIKKQDASIVKQSIAEAMSDNLRVEATPTLFINGEKVDGALPIETVYAVIDRALVAAGVTPPPPVKTAPAVAAPPAGSGVPGTPASSGTPATAAGAKPGK